MKSILFLFLCLPLSAAVTASTQWQVWTSGNDLNGGCFDSTVTAPGTNYARQTAAQATFNGTSVTATGTTATLTITGYTVLATDNGNCLQIASGTNYTAGTYVITSVDTGANTWTLNANPTTGSASALTAKMGGAVAAITKPVVVAGNRVWVKATGTYSRTTTGTLNTTGTTGAWIVYEGYTTTEGDGGKATIQITGSSLTVISSSGSFRAFRNFVLDCNSQTSSTGLTLSGGSTYTDNVKVTGCTANGGINISGSRAFVKNSWVTGVTGTAGVNITGDAAELVGVRSSGNSVPGFLVNRASGTGMSKITRCIADGQTSGAPGFKVSNTMTASFTGVIAYNNAGDGILYDQATTASAADGGQISGSIFVSNGGYGINANATNLPFFNADYNAFYNNTSGDRNNLPTGSNDVALTAVPFVDAAAANFAPNAVAGGGVDLKGAGWPGVLQSGGQGYLDIGAIQSAGTRGQVGWISVQ